MKEEINVYYPNAIEEICYDKNHIQQVLAEIKINFYDYFDKFIQTEDGNKITESYFKELSNELGSTNIKVTKRKINKAKLFKNIINDSIKLFEKDRDKYLDILNEDYLE